MSQVLVWKSDADGMLFEDKKKYSNHLRKLAAKRNVVKREMAYEDGRQAFFDLMGQVASFNELEQFIIDNWQQFRTNSSSIVPVTECPPDWTVPDPLKGTFRV